MILSIKNFKKPSISYDSYSWVETFAVCLIVLFTGVLARPDDPFFTATGVFPWFILAPVLAAVRYGFSQSFCAALIILFANIMTVKISGRQEWALPGTYSLGMFAIAMLVGEFRDIWSRKLVKLERSNEYRQARLDEFTKAYHVMKISHDRLEQENAGKSNSLVSALLDLQKNLSVGDSLKEKAPAVLALLKQNGVLQLASLHLVVNNEVSSQALASVGDVDSINTEDKLLKMAIKHKMVMSVSPETNEQHETENQACVPLVDSDDVVHGMLVIKQMPFFSFNEHTLKLLAVLGGRIADILSANKTQKFVGDEQQYNFVRHLNRCLLDAKQYDVESTVLSIAATNPVTAHNYISSIQKEMRGLDSGFVSFDQDGNPCLMLLMPLTSPSGFASYMLRLEILLAQLHQVSKEEAGIRIHHTFLSRNTTKEKLLQFLVEDALLDNDVISEFGYLQDKAA